MTKFLVSFDIPASIELPRNSVAEVYSSDILGSKAMRIIIGNDYNSYLAENDTMLSQTDVSMFAEIGKMLEPYSKKIENIVSNLDSVVESVNTILNDKSQQEIQSMITNVNEISIHLASLSKNLNDVTAQEKEKIHTIVDNIEKLSETLNDEKLALIIDNIANISDTLANANISSAMQSINSSLESLSGALNTINKGSGNLGLLVNDDNLYKNLEHSTQALDSLINDIKANPKRYLNISIF